MNYLVLLLKGIGIGYKENIANEKNKNLLPKEWPTGAPKGGSLHK